MKKKIIVISAGRSDYSRFYPILDNIIKLKSAQLYLYLTLANFNKVFDNIKNKFPKKLKILKSTNSPINFNDKPKQTVKNLSLDLDSLAKYVQKIKPDVIIVIGDRYEMLIGPLVAIPNNIPTVHFFGGAITEGAIDELVRHGLTKMSHYHFVLLDLYKRRLLQLGEEPWRIKRIGLPSLSNLNSFKFKSLNNLSQTYKFNFAKPFMIVTFHPVTLELKQIKSQLSSLINSIKSTNLNAVITYPNSDPSFNLIIKEFINKLKNKNRYLLVKNLGEVDYFSLMKLAKLMIGNSSSGIVEAVSFKLPVVNIGTRQDGKLKPKNVIDTGYSLNEIKRGIKKALKIDFLNKIKKIKNPYHSNDESKKIAKMILNIKSNQKILRKKFINKI